MSEFDDLFVNTPSAKPTGNVSEFDDLFVPTKTAEKPSFTFDTPAPKARKKIGTYAPNTAEDFTSSLKAGSFSVTPANDAVASGYDSATDKWKFKQTLSNTELDHLAQVRPDSVSVSSVSDAEKERQRAQNSVKVAPGTFTPVLGTKLEAPTGKSYTESEMRVEKLGRRAAGVLANPSYDAAKKVVSSAAKTYTQNLFDEVTGAGKFDPVANQKRNAQIVEASAREDARRATLVSEFQQAKKQPIDPTTGGEFYKALKQGLLRDVPRGFFSSVEAITAGDGSMKTVNDWASQQADEFLASRLLHPEENAPTDVKNLMEGGYKDPRYWERGAGQLLSTAIPAFASAIGVGLVTKNPAVAARVGMATIYSQESGQAYADLVDSGFAPSDAKKGAVLYGAVATALENVNFGKTLTKVLGTSKSTIAKESFRKALLESLKEVWPDVLKESGTEAAQQLAQNAMTKWYNENQDLMEGVADSAALGALGGVGFGAMNVASDTAGAGLADIAKLRDKYLSNVVEARDVASGKVQATEEEKAVATESVARYQQAAKQTAVRIKDEAGTPAVVIETVKYDDGKVSSSARVNVSPTETVTAPLSGEYPSVEEAVKGAAEKAKEILATSPSPSPQVVAQVEEAVKSPESALMKPADELSKVEQTAPESAPEPVKATEQTAKESQKNVSEMSVTPKAEDTVSVSALTEWPLKGQYQAFVTEWPNKSKFGIGNTEAEARAKLDAAIAGQETKVEIPKKSNDGQVKETAPVSEAPAKKSEKKPAESNKRNTEKLRKVAETTRAKAEEELNRDRQDNTSRRASMADSARERARQSVELANTLEKIADSIDAGTAESLKNVRSKADLERLETLLRVSQYRYERDTGKRDLATAQQIEKYAPEWDVTRQKFYRSDVEKITPADYAKATKAGVRLKAFVARMQSSEAGISIPAWEKEIDYVASGKVPAIDGWSARSLKTELTDYRAIRSVLEGTTLGKALAELRSAKEGTSVKETPEQALKRKERDLVQKTNIEGFFPTPENIVSRMVDEAGIRNGMDVLEPSAGIGSIADAIRSAGVEPDVAEYNSSLAQHLADKGYNVVANDFMEIPQSKKYDRILMNPPFERLQDTEHVMKAYSHLKPGGKLVAIMGESAFFNSAKKAADFREWLDSVSGYSEKLPEGTFKESLRSTGVATRLVVIEKTMNDSGIVKAVSEGENVSNDGRRSASTAHALKSAIGNGITAFAERNEGDGKTDFKLSERVKEIIDHFDTRFSRFVSPGSVGTFFPKSKNLALRSVNEVSVVHHELSHLIDNAVGVTAPLVGFRENGRRFATDAKTVHELTKAYVENYPGAKKTDDLRVRVMEGYAVIQQINLENPTRAKEAYPYLYAKYVQNAVEMQKDLNSQMEALVRDYQNLGAKGRVWAVLSRAINRKSGEQFLTAVERVHEFLTNKVYRFEKLDKLTKEGTKRVSDMMHGTSNWNQRIRKNLTMRGAWTWHLDGNGEPQKVSSDNVADLWTELAKMGKIEEFSTYLIARDQFESRKRLADLETKLKETESEAWPFPSRDQQSVIDKLKRDVESLKTALKNNEGILSKNDVESVFKELDPMFADFARRFDALTHEDLRALLNAGAISKEYFDELSEQTGYAPMKRLIDDGFIGENPAFSGAGKNSGKVTKASSMKKRTGGSHDIIDPMVAFAANHNEVMRKTLKQHTMNRLFDAAVQFPELAQDVDFKTVNIDGRVTHLLGNGEKLEKATNVVVKMVDGKPKAAIIREDFVEALDAIFKVVESSGLERFSVKASRLFSRGTTGAYLLYTGTNVPRDQQTALINSEFGYNPGAFPKYAGLSFYAMLKDETGDSKFMRWVGKYLGQFSEWASEANSEDGKLVQEFLDLGGAHNTSLNFNEMTGDEIIAEITRQKNGLRKAMEMLDAGLDLVSLPSNVSEIATRAQEYVKARKAGLGKFAALEKAGRVSTPFHHGGTIMANAFARGSINSIPYMKAAMQGLAQYMDTATRDKKWTTRALLAPVIVAAAHAVLLINRFDDSDDETKSALLNMDPSMFGRYLLTPLENGKFWKMAIDQSIGWLGALETMLFLDIYHWANYSVKEYSDALTAWFPDQLKVWQPLKATLSVVPQILKPLLEVGLNKTTYPSVRDLESKAMQAQLPYLRFKQWTSPVAKYLARTDLWKVVGLSPIQIDHLLEGYIGRVVRYATLKPSAYDPKSPFVQEEYFTSGRIIQAFYDRYGDTWTAVQEKNAENELKWTKQQKLEYSARKKRADEIKDQISDLRDMDERSQEYRLKRNEIWKNVNDLMFHFDPNGISAVEKVKFAKSENTEAFKEKKKQVFESLVEKYASEPDSVGKATRYEKQLKEALFGTGKLSDSDKERLSRAKTAFRYARSSDTFVKTLADADNNDEKKALFDEKKKSMGEQPYREYVRKLMKERIVSEEFAKTLLKK